MFNPALASDNLHTPKHTSRRCSLGRCSFPGSVPRPDVACSSHVSGGVLHVKAARYLPFLQLVMIASSVKSSQQAGCVSMTVVWCNHQYKASFPRANDSQEQAAAWGSEPAAQRDGKYHPRLRLRPGQSWSAYDRRRGWLSRRAAGLQEALRWTLAAVLHSKPSQRVSNATVGACFPTFGRCSMPTPKSHKQRRPSSPTLPNR